MKASPSAFNLEVKELILKRAGFRCDRCGLKAASGQFHHRNPRRMGGSDSIALGLPSNGVLLHPSCHDFIESHRNIAASLGFILGAAQDPMEWPVYLWSGWAFLNEDGTLTPYSGVPPLYGPPRLRDDPTADGTGRGTPSADGPENEQEGPAESSNRAGTPRPPESRD